MPLPPKSARVHRFKDFSFALSHFVSARQFEITTCTHPGGGVHVLSQVRYSSLYSYLSGVFHLVNVVVGIAMKLCELSVETAFVRDLTCACCRRVLMIPAADSAERLQVIYNSFLIFRNTTANIIHKLLARIHCSW